jgi:hypothetical protein
MLDLDAPRWAKLRHSDGEASKVPLFCARWLPRRCNRRTVPNQLISLAERAGPHKLATTFRLATGTLRCPKCGDPFPLWDTLLEPTDL